MNVRNSRLPPPLRIWLPGSLLLLSVALQLLALSIELRRGHVRAVDETKQYTLLVGTLISSQVDATYRMHLPQGQAMLMGLMAADPKVDAAAVIDPSGKILSASDLSMQGLNVEQSRFAKHSNLLSRARQTNNAQTKVVGDAVLGAFPIMLFSPAKDDRQFKVLVVVTEHRLTRALASARSIAIERALLQGVAILGLCILLYLLIGRWTLSRLSRLAEVSKNLAAGDYSVRSELTGSDEIHVVAQAFDTMAGDIQERDAQLRSSAQRLARLLDNLEDAVLICDREANISMANGAAFEMFSVEPGTLECSSLLSLFADAEQAVLRGALTGSLPEHQMVELTRTPNGTEKVQHLEVIVRWLENPELVGGAIVNIRDVTERRGLEDKLLASRKLELVGQLAGGVAHDFNNLLSVILANGENILAAESASWTHRKELEQMVETAMRGGALTRQLLTMGRRDMSDNHTIDAAQITRELEPLLRGLLPENIAFEMPFLDVPSWIRGNVGLLEQIIVNLVVNARDAMANGGSIRVWVENLGSEDAPEGVRLRITDTGSGMPEDMVTKIFDPFFSTKPIGVGTGLGLTTVQSIVRDLGGSIKIDSVLGRGTTFDIQLPAAEAPAIVKAPKAEPIVTGSECILYVEDEDGIREALTRALRDNGYQVYAFATAEEVLVQWQEIASSVDIVATDLMLPGINGHELASKLRTKRLNLPVLFVSGYTDAAEVRTRIVREGEPLLQKPFTSTAFMGEIRKLIDATQSPPQLLDVVSTTVGTILIAEDLDLLSKLMRTVLEDAGYRVLVAEDGESALALYKANSSNVPLVILDLGLPKISGSDLARQIVAHDDEVKVIISSGRDASSVAQLLDSGLVAAFLPKPFTPDTLLAAVRAALHLGSADTAKAEPRHPSPSQRT